MQSAEMLRPQGDLGWEHHLEETRFRQAKSNVGSRFAKQLRKSWMEKASMAASLAQGSLIGAVFCYFLFAPALPLSLMYGFAAFGAWFMARKQFSKPLDALLLSVVAGLGMTEVGFLPALSESLFDVILMGMGGLAFLKGYHQHGVEHCEDRSREWLKVVGAGVAGIFMAAAGGPLFGPISFLLVMVMWFRLPEIFGRQLSGLTLNTRLKKFYQREQLEGVREPMDSEAMLEFFNKDILEDLLKWKDRLTLLPGAARRMKIPKEQLEQARATHQEIEAFTRWFYARVLVLKGLEDRLSARKIQELRFSPRIAEWEKKVEEGEVTEELVRLTEALKEEFGWAEDYGVAEQEVIGDSHAQEALGLNSIFE